MGERRSDTLPVPYLSKLEGGGLTPGQSVVVRGVMLEGEGFSINLCSGPRIEDGCPLHFNCRPDDKKIVLNSLSGTEWGKEEREKLIIEKDGEFTIRIRCHDSHFELFTNQKEIGKFEYRAPLSSVDHLLIKGGLELHGVNWGGKYYPVPYQAGVTGGFTPGKKLFVSAAPEEKGVERFNINLLDDAGNVILHFNPRFNEKAVVRNSKLNGEWGTEEREGKFPFDKKLAFDICIANESYAFQIHVNGALFCAFAHRTNPDAVSALQIEGDIELQNVHVK